jgi:hypothetical protein
MIKAFMIVVLGFHILLGSGQERQMLTDTEEELNLALIVERIAKTSPEGLKVIEKAKKMLPEMQNQQSAKTLGEAVEACINGRGQFIIYPIGWEVLKMDGSHWRIFFYFQDEEKKYVKATWGYDDDRKALIPMEFTNATKFWVRRSRNLRP